jgi:hypothetical protein
MTAAELHDRVRHGKSYARPKPAFANFNAW